MKKDDKEKNFFKKIFKYKEKKLGAELQIFSMLEVVILIMIVSLVSVCSTTAITYQLFKNDNQKYTNLDETANSILETYNYILDNYYGDLNKKDLLTGAISGMLDSVGDKNSSFIEPESSNTFNITLEGTYKGLGIEIYNEDDKIIISKIIDDSPAKEVNLKEKDIIKKVDDMNLEGVSTADFVSYVGSKKNNEFNLLIERDGKEMTIIIKKDSIILKSVTSEIINQKNKKIGYIDIDVFAKNTDIQFKKHLNDLEEQNMDSLIIDLRGNTGGHLSAVTSMLDLFMKSDKVIYQTEDKNGTKKIYSKGKNTKEYPIVILVDGSSASASEIMTAALKEQLSAYVIGTTTYGKGTVQELQTISGDVQYKFTTKKWLTPLGEWIDGKGISPDLEITIDIKYYENMIRENDNQLKKAIEYLENK